MTRAPDLCIIAAVNDDSVLEANLMASPLIGERAPQQAYMRHQPSASIAYNAGLDQTSAPICVFAHQDVYFPAGWLAKLKSAMAALETQDPDWAVLGLFGVARDGSYAGRVWSSGLNRELGRNFTGIVAVQSIDEMVIIVRRASGLRFDAALPGFHFYGTDIVQMALSRGLGAYVINAPAVHNSVPVQSLGEGFQTAYDYMRRKWAAQLPIVTTVTRITRSGFHQWKRRLLFRRRKVYSEEERLALHKLNTVTSPAIAARLGYE